MKQTKRIKALYHKVKFAQDIGLKNKIIRMHDFTTKELKSLADKHEAKLELPTKEVPRYKLNFSTYTLRIELKSIKYIIHEYYEPEFTERKMGVQVPEKGLYAKFISRFGLRNEYAA